MPERVVSKAKLVPAAKHSSISSSIRRPDSQTVMAQLPKWFDDYNSYHPHGALRYLPAKLFREKRAVN